MGRALARDPIASDTGGSSKTALPDVLSTGPSNPARSWFRCPPGLRIATERSRPRRWLAALGQPATREAILRGYQLPQEYRAGYYERRIYPRLHRPSYRPGDEPDHYYRGMYLTIDELQNIVRNGLEVERTSWHAGGASGISFSTSPDEAATYIFQTHRPDQGIGVVVIVRDDEQIEPCPAGELNPCGTIHHSPTDVPVSKIVDVCLWGRWGLERLDDVLAKVSRGEVLPHSEWTHVFDR